MANVEIWGSELRKLRKKVDVTQGELVEKLSYLVSNLSDDEQNKLAAIDLYEEVTTYFGGILDTPTLSKLERGKRTLSRKRTVALVWGLAELGVLETADQANRFLEAAEYGHLTPTEKNTLFDTTFEPILKPEKSPELVDITTPQAVTKQRRFSPLIAVGIGVLILGLVLGLLFPRLFRGRTLVNPDFEDDFSGEAINSEVWDVQDAPYASMENGRLLFDTPVNQGEWYEEKIKPIESVDLLSRLTFDVAADTPETYQAGSIGVGMGCWNGAGWLNVYAGEDTPHIFVEYASSDDADWETEVQVISLRPIEQGETYSIDLNWSNNDVAIMINNELAAEAIPCNRTRFFTISTSIGPDQKVRGTVDHIRVWH